MLGEEVANELVDWFNAVDLTYRADLRELNELNFARFDAKLEQRLAGPCGSDLDRRQRSEDATEGKGRFVRQSSVGRPAPSLGKCGPPFSYVDHANAAANLPAGLLSV